MLDQRIKEELRWYARYDSVWRYSAEVLSSAAARFNDDYPMAGASLDRAYPISKRFSDIQNAIENGDRFGEGVPGEVWTPDKLGMWDDLGGVDSVFSWKAVIPWKSGRKYESSPRDELVDRGVTRPPGMTRPPILQSELYQVSYPDGWPVAPDASQALTSANQQVFDAIWKEVATAKGDFISVFNQVAKSGLAEELDKMISEEFEIISPLVPVDLTLEAEDFEVAQSELFEKQVAWKARLKEIENIVSSAKDNTTNAVTGTEAFIQMKTTELGFWDDDDIAYAADFMNGLFKAYADLIKEQLLYRCNVVTAKLQEVKDIDRKYEDLFSHLAARRSRADRSRFEEEYHNDLKGRYIVTDPGVDDNYLIDYIMSSALEKDLERK